MLIVFYEIISQHRGEYAFLPLRETDQNMIIRNIQVFLPDKSFHKGCIVTKDDKIERIYTQKEEEGSGKMDDPNLMEDAFSIWRGKPGFREKQDIIDGRWKRSKELRNMRRLSV